MIKDYGRKIKDDGRIIMDDGRKRINDDGKIKYEERTSRLIEGRVQRTRRFTCCCLGAMGCGCCLPMLCCATLGGGCC